MTLPISINAKTQFTVVEVAAHERNTLGNILKEWHDLAALNFTNAVITQLEPSELPQCDYATIARLNASISIISRIVECLSQQQENERKNLHPTWDTVLICRDNTSKIQAVALTIKKANNLIYLATNPDNIPYPSTCVTPVRGAGSAIILHLASETLKTGQRLFTRSHSNAENYYIKLHFEGNYLTGFALTATRVKELVDQKVSPFNQLIQNETQN